MALRYNLKPGQVIQLRKPGSLAIDIIDGKMVAFITTTDKSGVRIYYRPDDALGTKRQNRAK